MLTLTDILSANLYHHHHHLLPLTSLLVWLFIRPLCTNYTRLSVYLHQPCLCLVCLSLTTKQLASQFSLVAPFDASAVLLVIGTIVVATTWTENYGDQFSTGFSNFRGAVSVLMSSKEAATATATSVPRSHRPLPPRALLR